MSLVHSGNVALKVEDRGSGELPFLFVHGWAADSTVWEPQMDDLSRSFRCVSVDLRGRGGSPVAHPCDVVTAAEDLAAVIRELALGPVIVVGQDIGGLAALVLNHQHTDLVTGVVTADAPIGAAPRVPADEDKLADRIRGAAGLGPAAGLVDSFFRPGTSPELAERLRRMIEDCPVDVAAGMLEGHEFEG
ncbi:MAG: alpha/beta fold hydrolase, partial [Dehalococcoidia bacterium]